MRCNLCQSNNSQIIAAFGEFSIAHQYMKMKSDERATYPFDLALCRDCDHVFIAHPISPGVLYENYFTLSDWKFQPHIPRLIELLWLSGVDKKANILEVGCNDGRFLKAMQDEGYENLFGIEPCADASTSAEQKGIRVVRGFF